MSMFSIIQSRRLGSPKLIRICMAGLLSVIWCGSAQAAILGSCADCHTMHNSQNNAAMNFDGSTTPNENLTRGDCYGCHAQGGASSIVTFGSSRIPQVLHSGATDLAGGNFWYIENGIGPADSKGHNIGDLTGIDAVLYGPPGGLNIFTHNDGGNVNTNNLSCAGTNGCHGYRLSRGDSREGITGAHHKNANGQINLPTDPGSSYRFLMGVKGFEDNDWEQNPSASTHNEYFSVASPVKLGCAISCHGDGGVQPPDGTMSQFCATCHGNFHTLEVGQSDGIGTDATSPFIRHPTDLSLPTTGEYADYKLYNLSAPVGRLTVPANSSNVVSPGSDTVMCLSCHVAHASNFASMLRWDYTTIIAGNGGAASNTGCFVCHTTKD